MRRTADCDAVRESVSSRLDGETAELSETRVESHLRTCLTCRSWHREVSAMTERSRVRPPRELPDLSASVVASTVRWASVRRIQGPWSWERWLLLALGTVQLVMSLPVLLFHQHAPGLHLSHEVGVTDLALAVGVLAAAWQPWRAAGMLPVIMILAGGLGATSVLDIAAGRVSAVHELPHLLALADAVLLVMLRRRTPPASTGLGLSLVGSEAAEDARRTA